MSSNVPAKGPDGVTCARHQCNTTGLTSSHAPQTDDRLGGNTYYVGSAELRFPLGLPEELRVFGRSFVDAGSLQDIDVSGPTLDESNGLRVAAGVGLSWLSPLGPLSIDFAQALKKESKDETEFFRLSFGTRF